MHYSDGDHADLPVEIFFRTFEEMPEIEQFALHLCKGKVLDIGAGAGEHALYLQERGVDVTGLDIAEGCQTVMQEKGLQKVLLADIMDYSGERFDTLLMLNFKHTGLSAAGFILGGLAVGLSTFGQPHLVSRFMALRNQQALSFARWIAIGWFTIVFFGMCLLGLSMRALLPELSNPEALFFEAAANLLPNVFAGIMIAAVLSAIMSTADSMLLAAAASVSHDIGVAARYPKKELLIARLSMVALSLAAIFLALLLPASIFDRALFAWVAIGSAFGPILVFKLSGRSAHPTAILYAMVLSFTLAVGLHNLPNTPGDIAERTLPFLLGLLTLFAASKRPKNL